jgi:hypothetical protein
MPNLAWLTAFEANVRLRRQRAAALARTVRLRLRVPRNLGPRVRSAAAGGVAMVAAGCLLLFFDGVYPVSTWLTRTLAIIWAWQALLAAAMALAGRFLLVDVLRVRGSSELETLALAAPVGAMAFAMGMYVAGFLALYSPTFAVIWPAALVAVGLPSAARACVFAHVARQRAAGAPGGAGAVGPAVRRGPAAMAAAVGGGLALALALVYLGLLSPSAVNYDAQWYHLTIAQDYAREGRIFPWVAAWTHNLPHLASVMNTWSFLVPGLSEPPTRWMMALHTELVLFVWTLVGVAAAIASMLGRARPPAFAWLVMFFFPAIFVYDSNMGGSADHFVAFFAAPLLLAVLGTARTQSARWWVVLAVVASGALLTKLQAVYLLVPAAVAVMLALARRGVMVAREHPARAAATVRRLLRGPLLALGVVVVLTAPHFVKNVVHHHNPIYPFGQDLFSGSRPTISGASVLAGNVLATWSSRPPAALGPRLKSASRAVIGFSFNGKVGRGLPYIGSLFTLSLLLVPFLRRSGRIRQGVALAMGTLALWAFVYQVDRNLQTFLPLLAAVTGAVLARAWELGRTARVGLTVLVAVQGAWGADLAFSGKDRIGDALALIRSGMEGSAHQRFHHFGREAIDLGRALPPDAVVLLHNRHLYLGIDRKVLLDWIGFQGLIDHRTFRTLADIHERFRQLGVTHVVYTQDVHRASTLQEEVLFALFFARYPPAGSFGGLRYLPLPAAPPPVEPAPRVMLIGVSGYQDGLYEIEDLGNWHEVAPELQSFPRPRVARAAEPGGAPALIARAQAVLVGTGAALDGPTSAALEAFQVQTRVAEHAVHVRKP